MSMRSTNVLRTCALEPWQYKILEHFTDTIILNAYHGYQL